MAYNKNVMMADTGGSVKKKQTGENAANAIAAAANKAKEGINSVVNAAQNTAAQQQQQEQATPTAARGGGGSVSTASAPAASTPNYDTTVPNVFGSTVDPELQAQYQNAMAALEQMKGQAPTYGSQYDAQIQSLYQQIIGRGPFKYDSKTDPLYQQYVQDYTQQGKMAMRDTMGQAAALTGGYGSSYAQSVGQQQYDQYLQRMADILPETYGMALNAYNAQGDQLNQQLATTTDLERSDYNRYLDQLNQYNIDVNRAQSDADTAYDRMVAAEKQNYSRQLDMYDIQKDNYNRLIQLIAAGHNPSKEEYNAAGLSEAQGAALKSAYAPAPASSSPTVHRIPQNNAGNSGASDDDMKKEYDAIKAIANVAGGVNQAVKKIKK